MTGTYRTVVPHIAPTPLGLLPPADDRAPVNGQVNGTSRRGWPQQQGIEEKLRPAPGTRGRHPLRHHYDCPKVTGPSRGCGVRDTPKGDPVPNTGPLDRPGDVAAAPQNQPDRHRVAR
jgi:hypothetical protein